MAKKIKTVAIVSFLLTVLCSVLYYYKEWEVALTFAITFGTIAYHFIMRLVVGFVLNLIMHNHADYNSFWFRVRKKEFHIYNRLKVKKWKGFMPTYDMSLFDNKIHTWDEIAQAMCQAELVHEVIVVLSFLPIFAAIPFGAWAVFVITSILSALFDMMFVIMQRYNRSRVVKLLNKR